MYMYYNILIKCNHWYHGYRGFCLTPRNLRVVPAMGTVFAGTGTVFVGTGTVWQNPTRGLPILNPNYTVL